MNKALKINQDNAGVLNAGSDLTNSNGTYYTSKSRVSKPVQLVGQQEFDFTPQNSAVQPRMMPDLELPAAAESCIAEPLPAPFNNTIEPELPTPRIITELSIKCPFCKTRYAVAREIYNSFKKELLPFDCYECEHEFFDRHPRPILDIPQPAAVISKLTDQQLPAPSLFSEATEKNLQPALKLVKGLIESKQQSPAANIQQPLVCHQEPVFEAADPLNPCKTAVVNHEDSLKSGVSGVSDNVSSNITENDQENYKFNYPDNNPAFGANNMSKKAVKNFQKSQLTFSFPKSESGLNTRIYNWLHSCIKSSWTASFFIAAPILFFLALLIGVTVFFKVSPDLFPSMVSALSINKSIPAPPGLIVQDTEFRTVALENGETLYVVSGRVTNTTSDEFKDVKVEGIAYNAKGEYLQTSIGYLSNPLNSARIRSLSTSEIFDLQISKKERFDSIKAGESHKFTVVLSEKYSTEVGTSGAVKVISNNGSDNNLKYATYFSARVHSVAK